MLFKASLNTKAEEIRKYISVNSSISFASISPYIESTESTFTKKILGTDQYLELCAYYEDPEAWPDNPANPKALADDLAKLLKIVQKSLINLAFHDGFTVLSINIGDSGAYRQETNSQKPLYQYQEEGLKHTFRTEGFNGLDAILESLEDNIEKYPVFEASDTYTVFKSKFIKTTPEFDEIYHIRNSRLVFLHLQRFIDQVNDFVILPVLGRVFFDELIAYMTSGEDLQPKQVQLISFIQKIQAYLSVSKGIASLGVNITHNGAFFHSNGTNSSNYKKKESANSEDLHIIMRNAADVGHSYIEYMKDYLHENIADFPTYADFNAYNEGEPTSHRDNTDKKTFWA